MSLKKKVFNSAALLLLRKIWNNLINLFVMAFLARLLSKEDFGLLAISSVFISLINALSTSGIAEYIIYYDNADKDKVVNAAFWLNLILTILVITIVIVVGPYWSDFYKNEKVYYLLVLLAISFFFEMTSMVPKTILRQELEYKVLVYYTGLSMTAISLGKLAGAFGGLGVYSLVAPQAFISPGLALAFFLKTRWKPTMELGVRYYKAIFAFTKHIVGGRVLTKLVNEGDNIIVGKFVGLEGLGVYSLAFQLANLVTNNVVFLVNEIVLPVLSKVKNDSERLNKVYLKMISLLSVLCFPLIAAMAISAQGIVHVIYGEKWMDAVLPFQILCLFALGRSISSPSSILYSAVGKPEIGFKLAAVMTPIFLIAVYLGSFYGVVGVSISTTTVRFINSLVAIAVAGKLVNLSVRQITTALSLNALVAAGLVSISLVIIGSYDGKDFIFYPILIGLIPVIIYLFFLVKRIVDRADLQETLDYVATFPLAQYVMPAVHKALFIR